MYVHIGDYSGFVPPGLISTAEYAVDPRAPLAPMAGPLEIRLLWISSSGIEIHLVDESRRWAFVQHISPLA